MTGRALPILFAVAAAILAGQVLLKAGLQRVGPLSFEPAALFRAIPRLLASPWILAGLAVSAGATLAWLVVLSKRELSAVSPVMTGFYFLLLLLAGRFGLGEGVSPARWLGALLVLAGVFLIGRSE